MDSSDEEFNQITLYSNEDIGTALTFRPVFFQKKKISDQFSTKSSYLNLENNPSDVTLIVNNQKLRVHKNVLASVSDYFDRMFFNSCVEQDTFEINIVYVNYETLKTFVGYFYSSVLIITEHNVQDLLIGADIFLLDDVRDACVKFLETVIDVENCIHMKDLANYLCLDNLYSLCLTFIVNNFRFVANTQEFLTVNHDEIMMLVKNDDLFAKEEMVYDLVMNWIKYDPATRIKYSAELLWYVRLPLILNNYQGIIQVYEFEVPRLNGLSSFRMEHRKPFRKGILILGHYPFNKLTPEWYDATLNEWKNCSSLNCECKKFQNDLTPPQFLCTCILLDDGRLFAAGGYNRGKELKSAYMFDSKLNKWIETELMLHGRVKPYIIQIGWKVFVIGGHGSFLSLFIDIIEYYDLKKEEWCFVRIKGTLENYDILTSHIEDTYTFKNDTFITSVNESIYFISKNVTGFYDTQNNSWRNIPKFPVKVEGAAICTLNKNIYVIGGNYGGNYFKSVWAYCTETEVWVSITDMNSPRSFAGVAVMNGCIYVFGGKTDDDSTSNTFEIYNPHDNEWVTSNALMNSELCIIDAIIIEKNCTLFEEVFEAANLHIYY